MRCSAWTLAVVLCVAALPALQGAHMPGGARRALTQQQAQQQQPAQNSGWRCVKIDGCAPARAAYGSSFVALLAPAGQCQAAGGCDVVKAQGACRARWNWVMQSNGLLLQYCGAQCACPGEGG